MRPGNYVETHVESTKETGRVSQKKKCGCVLECSADEDEKQRKSGIWEANQLESLSRQLLLVNTFCRLLHLVVSMGFGVLRPTLGGVTLKVLLLPELSNLHNYYEV
ncbi:hypothetical protein HanHA300_Chr05g0180081 [Helianthus annuus]|nr:hypothetical protein HanHA300_Chr05g0180081 [Helianthus annuus]KAJ0577499.1 hypothetical protein HanIR_Chr05g0236681 [Helianthus annuus]KAJ0584960.1 hypothetical protein HanHA89_Chr05g0194781 [Helianthus annuus]KAJ0750627.1 hypothetical protein HanLR1_Chr05g0184151 [Helianthus annuus]